MFTFLSTLRLWPGVIFYVGPAPTLSLVYTVKYSSVHTLPQSYDTNRAREFNPVWGWANGVDAEETFLYAETSVNVPT